MPLFHSAFRRSPTWRDVVGTVLILLAIWVQSIVPLATLRMTAQAAPLGIFAICGHHTDGPLVEDQVPLGPGCGICPLCILGLTAPTIHMMRQVALDLRWTLVAWPIPPPIPYASELRSVGQPRAPPTSL